MIRTAGLDLVHAVSVEMLPILRLALDAYDLPGDRDSYLRRVRASFKKAVDALIRTGEWEHDYRLYLSTAKAVHLLTMAIKAIPNQHAFIAQAVDLVETIQRETAPFPFEPPY